MALQTARPLILYSSSMAFLPRRVQRLTLFSSRQPWRQGEVGHDYHRLFLRVFLPHLSLASFSINSLQILLSAAIGLQSPHALSWSFVTQSSHRILVLLRLLFHSTFWASVLFASFSSPILFSIFILCRPLVIWLSAFPVVTVVSNLFFVMMWVIYPACLVLII